MVPEEHNRIAAILLAYVKNEMTYSDQTELNEWLASAPENRELFNKVTNPETLMEMLSEYEQSKKSTWDKIVSKAPELKSPAIKKPIISFYRVAAAITILIISSAVYFVFYGSKKIPRPGVTDNTADNDTMAIVPGSNKATLTIAGGKTFVLDSLPDGNLVNTGGMSIDKAPGGIIKYTANISNSLPDTYNTLTIPRGGQYQVVLPDNSHVWLNSASSFRYPPAFKGSERKVWLSGEGYFEIAKAHTTAADGHDKPMPFIVYINDTDSVTVTGTHFNITGYLDEDQVSTTLLEGRVSFNAVLLKPGQQAVLNNKGLLTLSDKIDTAGAISWKNGLISFEDANVTEIMRKVARWYDIEPVYEGKLPERKFTGGIPRNSNLSEVFKVLDLNKIHYSLNGRRIVIKP